MSSTKESLISLAQVETTTKCPAHCPMCPRDIQKRPHGTMRTDLVYKAITQAVECGAKLIHPFINGEPLADQRMIGFVEWMAKEYPTLECGWYTNAALLTEDKAEKLVKSGNIKVFNISAQGGTKEVYEANMGLSWDRLLENVNRLIEINNSNGHGMQVRMNMCVFSKTADTVEDFRRLWENKVDMICFGCYSNVGGMVSDEFGESKWKDKPRLVCDRAMSHTYIYWNGDVGQCCFDLANSVVWGNLNDQSLRSVLESEPHRAMRAAHHKIDVSGMPPICQNCNACKFHG